MEKPTCIQDGCERPVRCKDLCRRHYDRWRRETPADLRPIPTLRERILAKVQIDGNGCWIWQGYVGETGYGSVRGNGASALAHQAAYAEWVGSVPDGTELDHLCRVRRCVNPEHLEPVIHRVNLLRSDSPSGRNARKTHCPANHPYAGTNLIIKIDQRGNRKRVCRTCRDARSRAQRR